MLLTAGHIRDTLHNNPRGRVQLEALARHLRIADVAEHDDEQLVRAVVQAMRRVDREDERLRKLG